MLRDDAAVIIKELQILYEQKNTALSKIIQIYRLQQVSVETDYFEDFMDKSFEADALMIRIDGLNFDISEKTDSLARLLGMNKKSFEVFCKESKDTNIINWLALRQTCEKSLEETAAINNNLLEQMEAKAKEYGQNADELARLRRIKKLV